MSDVRVVPEEIAAEFKDVSLGDARLDRRLQRVVVQLAASPASSFPVQMGSTADREALYRFLGNEEVTLSALLAPHFAETRKRIRGSVVRVAHDSTSLVYRGDREGLGAVKHRGQGFFAHCALAVDVGERREPLGILGIRTFAHTKAKEHQKAPRSKQAARCHHTPREEKLSSRWEKTALEVSAALPPGVQAIHVMDQEADDFAMLAALLENRLRFVVRGSGTRLTAEAKESLREVMGRRPGKLFRTVQLGHRKPRGSAPRRAEREAELSICWAEVNLQRSWWAQTNAHTLQLTVVHVYEDSPPEGEERIEWFLLTSEAVSNLEEATAVVDHYRARWVIEEYFKALKTGCAIEKRQLTNYDALVRTLGLFVPIAWKLLALRSLANNPIPRPAAELFDDEDLAVIRVLLRKRRSDHHLSEKPTVRDAMLAIAALGGHIKNNGDPGWLVLGRGFQLFVDAQEVWRAARSDQS